MSNLRKQIEILNGEMSKQLSPEILDAFAASITDLKNRQIEENSLKIGMKIPSFKLQNSSGEEVLLDNLLAKYKNVIIAFFRGKWCPYCNLELNALQNILDDLEQKNVKLVAISPQKSFFNKAMADDNELSFDLLSDVDNVYAKQLGIDFVLQEEVVPYYKQLGVNLFEYNGNVDNSLPIPAVFVLDKSKTIVYSYVNADYMSRIDIDDLMTFL